MRIQETNTILKESRYARNAASHPQEDEGVVSRAWHWVQRLMTRSKK
jgi:hypothetical protein